MPLFFTCLCLEEKSILVASQFMVVLKDDFLPSEGFLYFFFSLNEDINEEDYIVFRETEEIQLSAKTNIRKLV